MSSLTRYQPIERIWEGGEGVIALPIPDEVCKRLRSGQPLQGLGNVSGSAGDVQKASRGLGCCPSPN